ncbi:serine hydroxymethyltransferase, mitochondrial-like [Hydra vulgaris]|uniref:Serine hydroxymethyltransferase, mitochondrial-like n=1 Tax=Hydra vulgaris TaxID=6087 RepID=A0ABM4CWY7_HYDVU
MAKQLLAKGYDIVANGTDNHLVLIGVRPKGIGGSRVEFVLDQASIRANKNTVPRDKSAMKPSGLRLGAAAHMSRSFKGNNFVKVINLLNNGVEIRLEAQKLTSKYGA